MTRCLEDEYRRAGPWTTVVYDNGNTGNCDRAVAPSQEHTFVYPSEIGSSGAAHPVVVVGVGANFRSVPDPVCQYARFLEHLASWGLVAVAPNVGGAGDGTAMLDAGNETIRLNSEPTSPFYNRLVTSGVAMLGHSHGAEGAINAALASEGLVTTVVAVGLPRSCLLRDMALGSVTVPSFFVRGSDAIEDYISPEWANQRYFDEVSAPAAKATVCGSRGKQTGNCAEGAGGWHISPYNAFGYITAWLQYILAGCVDARDVFVGDSPEIAGNAGWRNWQSRDLS